MRIYGFCQKNCFGMSTQREVDTGAINTLSRCFDVGASPFWAARSGCLHFAVLLKSWSSATA